MCAFNGELMYYDGPLASCMMDGAELVSIETETEPTEAENA